MIIITNRNLIPGKTGLSSFGDKFNEEGAENLRIATAYRQETLLGRHKDNHIVFKLYDDEEVELFNSQKGYPSELLFTLLQKLMKEQNRNCVFYVHGYNTSFFHSVKAGLDLEEMYDVEVVLFSWPSNGSTSGCVFNKLKGLLSYDSDKKEASMSVPALDRTFETLLTYLRRYASKSCNKSLTLMCHSMGAYLLQQLVMSDAYSGETSMFDNIILIGADCANKDHEVWVDKIKFRKRLYILINEEDTALAASRYKFSNEYEARLGQWLKNLNSKNADYVDVTDDASLSHDYHLKEINHFRLLKRFIANVCHGFKSDKILEFHATKNYYSLKH